MFEIGGDKTRRQKQRTYSISVVPLNKLDIELGKKSNSLDAFFLKNLTDDKSKIALFGKNPFNFKMNLNKKLIIQTLSIEVNRTLRKCLDNEEKKKEASYFLFKSTLRLMLWREKTPNKNDLLPLFKKYYSNIETPKNAKKIILNNLNNSDFREILQFAENCLKFLYLKVKFIK